MAEGAGMTVLVTGGASGIGLATARLVLAGGGRVALAGRDETRLAAAAKELDGGRTQVLTVPADVRRTADLDRLVAEVRDRFGELTGVVANAGIAHAARAEDVTEDAFDEVVATNFKGAFFTVQKALPLLRRGGSVVLNASWLVHRGSGLAAVYAASKAAVISLARTLAPDLAGRGIRVNTVTPGHVATPMLDAVTQGDARIREAFRAMVALGRIAGPEEIAEVIVFLLTAKSGYVTGQEIVVDGGLVNSLPN